MIRRARWMRRILGVALGIVATLAVLALVETLSHYLYPAPLEYDTFNRVELAASVAAIPLPAMLIAAAGWFVAAFAGAWLALRIADWLWSALIVTAALIAGNIATLVALPYPLWMQLLAILAPLIGLTVARRLHHKPYKGEPLFG